VGLFSKEKLNMATVKNFGLQGVGSTVQWGKTGGRIKWDTDHFEARNKADGAYVAVYGLTPVEGSDPEQLTTKEYVDAVASGLDPKESVRVATTVAGTLATSFEPGDVIDGVSLVTGDRILIKNQADARENGIYVVNSSGAPLRAEDSDGTPSNEVSGGNFTFVEQGSTNTNSGWVLTGDGQLIPDTDNQVWVQFSGSGTFSAGAGLDLTGSVFSVNVDNATTIIDSDTVKVGTTADQTNKFLAGPNNAAATWAYVEDLYHTDGSLILDGVGGSTDYLQINAGTTGQVTLEMVGTSSDIDLIITPKGTGQVDFSGAELVNGIIDGGSF
jgi:hypothetical protein